MRKQIFLLSVIWAIYSCNASGHNSGSKEETDKQFSLKVRPLIGAKVLYVISNETKTEFEVTEKNVTNISKSDATVLYTIGHDSSGNYLIGIKYRKIHVYTKSGENETDYDTENPTSDSDPVGQMFAALKDANISVVIKSSGEIVKMNGFQEILNHVSNGLSNEDVRTREIIQKQWKQMIEQSLIKKNVTQLFELFPDSAVRIGDQWNFVTRQTENIAFTINSNFKLVSIDNGIANIESEGKITPDSTVSNIVGYDVVSSIEGNQDGTYEISIKAGMPITSKVSLNLGGTIMVNGRDIPFKMSSLVKMKGSMTD